MTILKNVKVNTQTFVSTSFSSFNVLYIPSTAQSPERNRVIALHRAKAGIKQYSNSNQWTSLKDHILQGKMEVRY